MSAQPSTTTVTPERILMYGMPSLVGACVLAAATDCRLFTHLEDGHATAAQLAERAGVSERGVQALLDGLAGMGLVQVEDGRYGNADDASAFLVEGRPAYVGGFVTQVLQPHFGNILRLPEAVRSGTPLVQDNHSVADNPMWKDLVLAIVPLAMPLALLVAEATVRGRGAVSILDVGGGSGVYSAVLLAANPEATATQLDWPMVNGIARDFVAERGVAARFRTVDGDFHSTDLGDGEYDVVIYSNIAHGESAETNAATFARIRRALRPGGVLVISDFVLDHDRRGHPFAGLFSSVMLVGTNGGRSYRREDYDHWLTSAGFADIRAEQTPTPSTLLYAR